MFLKKLTLILPALSGLLLSGCAVDSYYSSNTNANLMTMSTPTRYNISNSQTVYLKVFDNNNKLTANELHLLTETMNARKEKPLSASWEQAVTKYNNAYRFMNVVSNSTTDMKISCRSANPLIFNDSKGSVPVNIKTVIVLSPGVYSAAWMTSYILSATMAPMKIYNYGALLVVVTDTNNKVIGSRMIGLYRSCWFSVLLPTALFASSTNTGKASFFQRIEPSEETMQNSIAVRAVIEILCGKTPAGGNNPKWVNIRRAVIESLACGDEGSVIKLLKSARNQGLGGEELNGFCKMMGL